MLRNLLIACLLGGVLAAPAEAAQKVMLAPGIVYERDVEFTRHGPVVIHVMTAPKPGGLYGLRTVLSNGLIPGRETVTGMQRRLSPTATVGGVNGDLFTAEGSPQGVLLQSGVFKSFPHSGRSSVGLDAAGNLQVERVALLGTWAGSSQRRPIVALNRSPGPNGVALFTPAWGAVTPISQGTIEAAISEFPEPVPHKELTGTVVQVNVSGGGTPIPANGAVLVGRGSQAIRLSAEATPGQDMSIRLILKPEWRGIVEAIGGGPALVREGRPLFRAGEEFGTEFLSLRQPRSAVGQLADGSIVLVTADGGRRGFSVGLSNFELAQALVRQGAVTGAALDGGASATMAFEGELLNRPSGPAGERPVSNALFVFYTGVQAPPPDVPVLTPNGDGVDERQLLRYKLVRSSTVAVRLLGPDAVARYSEDGTKARGLYQLDWPGRKVDGSPELDGRWRFVVSAVDDEGQSSTVERRFTLSTTLGFLRVSPGRFVSGRRSRLAVSWRQTQQAFVVVTIESAAGALVRTLLRRNLGAGNLAASWDGRNENGNRVASGRYVARVSALNRVGRAELSGSFSVRRARR